MSYHRSRRIRGLGDDVRSPTRTSTEVRSPTSTSTEVRSPTSTSTEVRSPTSTSTDAYTSHNVTVTGGAGAGATHVSIYAPPPARTEATDREASREYKEWLARRMTPVRRATPDGYAAQDVSAPSNYVRATDLAHPDVSRSLVPRATDVPLGLGMSENGGLITKAAITVGVGLVIRALFFTKRRKGR